MAKFSVGQYLAYYGDAETYGVIQITGVDEVNQMYTFKYITNPLNPSDVGKTFSIGFASIDNYYQPVSYIPTPSGGFSIADLLPMSPMEGPPLPRFLAIYWPWYE